MTPIVTAGEMLDGHAALGIECPDRIHLNAHVRTLQSSGPLVAFMTQHLGCPLPSPALSGKIGQKFRHAVVSFADANDEARVSSGGHTILRVSPRRGA